AAHVEAFRKFAFRRQLVPRSQGAIQDQALELSDNLFVNFRLLDAFDFDFDGSGHGGAWRSGGLTTIPEKYPTPSRGGLVNTQIQCKIHSPCVAPGARRGAQPAPAESRICAPARLGAKWRRNHEPRPRLLSHRPAPG